MISQSSIKRVPYLLMLALPLACCLCFLFPASSYAHAFLIDSDRISATIRESDSTGQMDGSTFFRLIMVTLVNLSVVFWVGTQMWHAFVFQSTDTKIETIPIPIEQPANVKLGASPPMRQIVFDRDCERRFARRFALPNLLLLFVASIGMLIGHALLVSNSSFEQALSPALLLSLASSGQFGLYWSLLEMLVLLALALAVYTLVYRKPSTLFAEVQSWVDLLIALVLLFVMTSLASLDHTVTVTNSPFTFVILFGWLHLLASALWVGGTFYLALVCLPLLRALPLQEQAPTLLKTLTRFSPLAITGIILMAITGPLNATINMTSLDQLWQTAYGWSLLVKIFLVGCLLLASAVHLFLLRPRLAKTVQSYEMAKGPIMRSGVLKPVGNLEVKQFEGSITVQTNKMFRLVHWESLLGIGILVCAGILTVFVSTIQPAINLIPKNQTAQIKPFTTTLKTTDHQYTLQLQVSPNHIGNNVFTIYVLDSHSQPVSNVDITIYTAMLDMDMGVDSVHLQAAGNGVYHAPFQFTMAGGWQLLIKVRAPDSTIHETTIDLNTPF